MTVPGLETPSPLVAAASLALIAGVYLVATVPARLRRLVAGVAVAVLVAGSPLLLKSQLVFDGINCCDLSWWILFFCWPWGC